MRTLGIGGHHRAHRGQSDDWLTPPEIIEALGPFDLDPCASLDQPWPTAARHYTIEDNGLIQTWNGMVWCNPPYGPQTWRWMSRMADHENGMALLFARTETVGFGDTVWRRATSLLFIEGRLYFYHPISGQRASANAGGPSVLVAYGVEASDRLCDSQLAGARVIL